MTPPRLSISALRQLGHKQPGALHAKGIGGNWAHQHESSTEHVIAAPHRAQDVSITKPQLCHLSFCWIALGIIESYTSHRTRAARCSDCIGADRRASMDRDLQPDRKQGQNVFRAFSCEYRGIERNRKHTGSTFVVSGQPPSSRTG